MILKPSLMNQRPVIEIIKHIIRTKCFCFVKPRILYHPRGIVSSTKKCFASGSIPQSKLDNDITKANESRQEVLLLDIAKRNVALTGVEVERLKNDVINSNEEITKENIDSIFLAMCVHEKALAAGRSYFLHIFKTENNCNIASMGKFFLLCYVCRDICTEDDKVLVVEVYNNLISKYKILDSGSCENALLGLSITPSWREGVPLLEMCKLTSEPSTRMFNALITAAFTNGDTNLGWKLIESTFQNNKMVTIDFCSMFLFKDKNYMICLLQLLEKYNVQVPVDIANVFLDYHFILSSRINPKITTVNDKGRCINCSRFLKTVNFTTTEFDKLKNHFISPVLIGKNIFLKTDPSELKSFLDFIKRNGKVDVVIDGLNTAYSASLKTSSNDGAQILCRVTEHFINDGKKVLIIGRKHMERWPAIYMKKLRKQASLFLTTNLSADDPFVLYATISSGLGTIFVSRDQMRGHKFLLKDPELRFCFSKWQQIHQYYLKYTTRDGKVILQKPLPHLHSPQKSEDGAWHLPLIKDLAPGVPGHLASRMTPWLCLP